MATELERFRDHARRMAAGKQPRGLQGPAEPLTPEKRAEWRRLADEADEQIRRDELLAEGLFADPTPVPDVDEGLW